MIIRGQAFVFAQEPGINKRDTRQGSGSAVGEKLGDGARNADVFCPPKGQERKITEVIPTAYTMFSQSVPNGGEGREGQQRIIEPIGLGSVLIDAIGIGPGEDGSKVMITGCPAGSSVAEKGEVVFGVVADG